MQITALAALVAGRPMIPAIQILVEQCSLGHHSPVSLFTVTNQDSMRIIETTGYKNLFDDPDGSQRLCLKKPITRLECGFPFGATATQRHRKPVLELETTHYTISPFRSL